MALLLFIAAASQAQFKPLDSFLKNLYLTSNPNDSEWISESMVLCRDGSRYIGALVDKNSAGAMRFRLNTQDTISIRPDFVKKFWGADDILIYNTGQYHFASSWFLMLSNGYAWSEDFTTQLHATLGWRINKRFAAGMGMGYDSYESDVGGMFLWDEFHTLYGYGRYYLTDSKKRFYLDLKAGIGYMIGNWGPEEGTGGAAIQPGIGMIFPSRKWHRWFFSLSNAFQQAEGSSREFDNFSNPINTQYEIWYRRVMITVGVEIH